MTHDLTLPVSPDMLVYPGDPAPQVRRVSDLAEGDALTSSELSLSCHAGTHVDAPAHFLADGRTLDQFSVDDFRGQATVLEIPGIHVIGREHLEGTAIPAGHHLLLKTDNSGLLTQAFRADHCHLDASAAELLCDAGVASLGFDYYSVDDSRTDELPVHRRLAARGLLVYVCLDLSAVSAGTYEFAGLPLRLHGAEAAPVRAILWQG